MRLFTILKLRMRTLLKSRRLDRELEEELHYHIDREIERNVKAGMRPVEARRAAMLSFGGASQIQEECRDERRAAYSPASGAICNTLCVICAHAWIRNCRGGNSRSGHRRQYRGL